MTDTERLNLIDHYGWEFLMTGGRWFVKGAFGTIEVYGGIRLAVDAALKKQFEWSTK